MAERSAPEPLSIVPPGRAGAVEAENRLAVPPPGALPFEVAMAELERIVRELESGELGLEEALRLYERGVALIRGCGAQLDKAEARLQVLSLDASGLPVLAALEEPGA